MTKIFLLFTFLLNMVLSLMRIWDSDTLFARMVSTIVCAVCLVSMFMVYALM